MNLVSVRRISILAGLALVGLVIIQYYWIGNAVKLREDRFRQEVRTALNDVVEKLDKQLAAQRIKRRLEYRKQGILSRNAADTATTGMPAQMDNTTNVQFQQQMRLDSNNVTLNAVTNTASIQDTSGINIAQLVDMQSVVNQMMPQQQQPVVSQQQNLDWVNRRTDVVNDIFDELVSITIYNDYRTQLDTQLVDSLLKAELHNQGINAKYIHAIYDPAKPVTPKNFRESVWDSLLTSNYHINLTPENIFIQQQMLSVYFPNERGYILQTMWVMLLLSGLFVLFIIFAFYFTIVTILRQKKLSEIKNDFVSNMTHELKTPISTISLACEVLGDNSIDKTPERLNKYVRMIRDENKRLSVLVESVLQTAILEKGKFNLKPVTTDIHELITHAIGNIRLLVEKKEGTISVQLHAENPVIECDKTHVLNVIYNLLDNAIKYTPGKPEIRVETRNTGQGIEISVSDNGIGISKDNQKKIFDKLFRVPTGNVHDVKGFGLGLSYVKAIAEKHGGTVGVDSEPGKGSRFFVYLPNNTNQISA
ncbi:MAG: histidine kinase [Bacteroidetes bacterium]|nr:MAG: histidine kinase [Bacteroidota bacterium]